MFDSDRFWEVVETAKESSKSGQFGFQDEWQSAIGGLKDGELADAAHQVSTHVCRLSSRRTFAAYVLHTRKGEDFGYARYCEWIISHGKEHYEAFLVDPQSLVGKSHPRCRWQDTNLYQSVLMFIGIRARFRPTVAIASFQDGTLKNPGVVIAKMAALAICPELEPKFAHLNHASEVDNMLQEASGITPETASLELPVLAKGIFLESLDHPMIDRRTPMTIHKFWEVMGICRSLGGRPGDLRSILGLLPSAQVAQFHELLRACMVSAVSSPLGKSIPPGPCPEAFLFSLALEGQEAYRTAVRSGQVDRPLNVSEPDILEVALEVFSAQTGMDLPPLVTRDRAA